MSQKALNQNAHPNWKVKVDGPIRIATGLYRKDDILRNFPRRAAAKWGEALEEVSVEKSAAKPKKPLKA